MNTKCMSDTLVTEQSLKITGLYSALIIPRLYSVVWRNYNFFWITVCENYLLVSCTVIKFKVLQVINIHAFCNKFSESREHLYVANVGLVEGIQMQMNLQMPSSLQTFFNILEACIEGINHGNLFNTKCKPKSTHTISYSNIIGNWDIFMLTRKPTLIHYINFKFSQDIEDIMLHKISYSLYLWNKCSIKAFTISFEHVGMSTYNTKLVLYWIPYPCLIELCFWFIFQSQAKHHSSFSNKYDNPALNCTCLVKQKNAEIFHLWGQELHFPERV